MGGWGEAHFTEVDGPRGGGELDLARFVVSLDHRFDARFSFFSAVEIDHANTNTEIEHAWLEYALHPALGFRAGVLLVPVGIINEHHEPPAFAGVQRPELDDVIVPTTWREAGLAAFGAPLEGVRYQVAVVDGLDAAKFSGIAGLRDGRQEASSAKANDFGFVARLDCTPIAGIELGLSAYAGKAGEQETTPNHARVTLGEADLRASWNGVAFRGQLAHAAIGDAKSLALLSPDPIGGAIEGWYAEISADGLRPLRERFEKIGRTELRPFFRLEHTNTQLDMPAGAAANGAENRIYKIVGATLAPIPEIAIKADYEWINARTGPLSQRWHVGIGYTF